MLNLDVVPSKMTGAEIKSWLNECAAEIEKAYDDDNVAYAQKLDSIYQVVKQMGIEKLQEESFTNYLKYANFLNESVTEEGNHVCSMQKGGEAPLSRDEILDAVHMAFTTKDDLLSHLD